jgi:hypothetical protein
LKLGAGLVAAFLDGGEFAFLAFGEDGFVAAGAGRGGGFEFSELGFGFGGLGLGG